MRFQAPLLLFAGLIALASGELSGTRSHSREFDFDLDITTRDTEDEAHGGLAKRGPLMGGVKDPTKFHMWLRTDTRSTVNSTKYDGVYYDGLDRLMKDTDGKHKDLVLRNATQYYEYGLKFKDNGWKKNPDGAEVEAYRFDYHPVLQGEKLDYIGVVGGGRALDDIGKVAQNEVAGKKYNHASYNAQTFVDNFSKSLL
ncbi:hypothetical protein F4778DRAFT_796550 [Xylariomycetidae sp. FL2044]|nr:hypothetical protein F4778DRAFT_796550 [Xylariomycetidae sp. FL2044]